jgi:C_GCAxxG_C_C family probable redox protein
LRRFIVADNAALKKKANELGERQWDVAGIEARVRRMSAEGIPRKNIDPKWMLARKAEILDRVQLRAEEYNFILKNCAQGTALALLEEFGLGSMEVVKALTAFPGIASSGEICGGITGSLIAFGLMFGGEDRLNPEAMHKTIMLGQKFMAFFEDEIGHLYCADIIETVILGHKLNPGESEETMATFITEKGFERCGLPPGVGVRLAAEFMIDAMNE